MDLKQQRIPLLDLSPEIDALWDALNHAIQRVLRSGQFIMGPDVAAFEEEVADFLGTKHAIGCNSGTDALLIGLRATEIGPGDEVITSPFSFFATAEAVSLVGATPIFIDIDPHTFNLDPASVEEAVTPRTKAILPVHLYGQAAAMDALLEIAHNHGLKVLEDTAQAFGGRFMGKMLGTLGDAGAFSFFPSKTLGAFGDAGLIATNDDRIAEIARMLRTHGSRKKYANEILGYNSRLDSIQAAILRVKLPHVTQWNEQRRSAARVYHRLLSDVEAVTVPYESPHVEHVYHQYTIRIQDGKRDAVRAHLAKAGIDTMVYYPTPIHQLSVYREMGLRLPSAEAAAQEVLSLPIWPSIGEDVQRYVVSVLREALEIVAS